MRPENIQIFTSISVKHVYSLFTKVRKRCWDPDVSDIAVIEYVQDTEHPGRPKTTEKVRQKVLTILTRKSSTREWVSWRITKAFKLLPGCKKISSSTFYRILNEART